MASTTVPVTLRAVIQRINRKLAHTEEMLKTLRGERGESDLGRHFVVNWRINRVVQPHADPEQLARELGVLKAWEHVAEDERA
jgi:hypothetical protein